MSEAMFTPGPWTLLPMKGYDSVRIFSGTRYICSVGNSDDEPSKTLAMANFIKASPDMYEAIKAALCDDPDWRRLCVEALAKAEGRTE